MEGLGSVSEEAPSFLGCGLPSGKSSWQPSLERMLSLSFNRGKGWGSSAGSLRVLGEEKIKRVCGYGFGF